MLCTEKNVKITNISILITSRCRQKMGEEKEHIYIKSKKKRDSCLSIFFLFYSFLSSYIHIRQKMREREKDF
jgi:hypothetical protein